jgi:hypothetical protein
MNEQSLSTGRSRQLFARLSGEVHPSSRPHLTQSRPNLNSYALPPAMLSSIKYAPADVRRITSEEDATGAVFVTTVNPFYARTPDKGPSSGRRVSARHGAARRKELEAAVQHAHATVGGRPPSRPPPMCIHTHSCRRLAIPPCYLRTRWPLIPPSLPAPGHTPRRRHHSAHHPARAQARPQGRTARLLRPRARRLAGLGHFCAAAAAARSGAFRHSGPAHAHTTHARA